MKNIFFIFFRVLLLVTAAALCAGLVIILYINAQLPSVSALEDKHLQTPLRIYTADGKLIGEYGEKRRTPITIEEVPPLLIDAILATEDKRFYEHSGVDLRSILRAALNLAVSGQKSQGASTITMQVARNFFLSRNKTFGRKLNEMLLAFKIERELPKDKILELYLNKIYFGKHAYGVQAAAQVYYGTTVEHLTLPQIAMIAGIPQAPSAINPIHNPNAARKRRLHVLKRMRHYGFIDEEAFEAANEAPVATHYHGRVVDMDAPHIAEMARQELVEKFGPSVYTSGFNAYTTIESRLQMFAQKALQEGLLEYDKRHGYRGPAGKLPSSEDKAHWSALLKQYPKTALVLPAAVLEKHPERLQVLLPNSQEVSVPISSWTGFRKSPSKGTVIYVSPSDDHKQWTLSQLPEVQGALVALNPKNGAILALVGGFDFHLSNFNRATQATRQGGSNFKPFIYVAALENGFTAASVINDAPVVYYDPVTKETWRPKNDSGEFYGPTRLRVGLAKSRNLVPIRLLRAVGIRKTIKMLERFGFDHNALPPNLSLALGAGTVSPLAMATAYATLANGGYKVASHLIQRVEDNQHTPIYQAEPPTVPDKPSAEQSEATVAPQIIDPQTAYIMTSILQDTITMGTARKARVLLRSDLAGKTGSTNNNMDAWFTGYNGSLLASVWVGFDGARSVQEYGSQAALPVWIKFMQKALKDTPQIKPARPKGIITVKIDPETGLLAYPGQPNAIFELFRQGTAPTRSAMRRMPEPSYLSAPYSAETHAMPSQPPPRMRRRPPPPPSGNRWMPSRRAPPEDDDYYYEDSLF